MTEDAFSLSVIGSLKRLHFCDQKVQCTRLVPRDYFLEKGAAEAGHTPFSTVIPFF